MKFLIISHVKHIKQNQKYYAYEPYVREMNIWLKYVDEVEIVAPLVRKTTTVLDSVYKHKEVRHYNVPEIEFTSVKKAIISIFKLPRILLVIFKACKRADHIHLRCPGNIGLLGCFVQILFPKKPKSAKYAGNWDPKAKQPLSYRIQKWMLRKRFLTMNMTVLVYGDWNEKSKNIVPFYTATYRASEKEEIDTKVLNKKINLLFVGTLSKGKQPLLSVKVVNELRKFGYDVSLDIYGEGEEQNNIKQFILDNNLSEHVALHGNKDKEIVKLAYKKAHFLVFMSKSEGWPKVVAEAMFWKCLPISTKVSCIPEMLGKGERGSIIKPILADITDEISVYINNQSVYDKKIKKAYDWSRIYTLDKFENEIHNILI